MTIRTHPKNSFEAGQQALFHEDVNSALQGLVAAMGGAKVVGSRLFPHLTIDGARSRLLDALNPDRAQELSIPEFLTLMRWGREAGHHGVTWYVADETGYTRPSPLSPEEERADLQRQFIEMGQRMELLARRMQK